MRLFILLLFLASCSTVYVPNTRNTPLFRKGGDFQAAVYAASGVDAQIAYAMNDRVAIMGNATYLSSKNSNPSFTRKNNFAELGLGLFGSSRSLRYEVFAGYGVGQSTSLGQYYFFYPQFGQKEIVATGSYQRIFVQPSFGTNNRKANIAFTPRLSLIEFSKFTSDSYSVKPDEKIKLLIEPAITTKFPLIGNLDAVLQLGITISPMGETYFKYESLQASAGIQLRIGSLHTRVY